MPVRALALVFNIVQVILVQSVSVPNKCMLGLRGAIVALLGHFLCVCYFGSFSGSDDLVSLSEA